VHLLDVVQEVIVVGAAQDHHLPGSRRSLVDLVHAVQGQERIAFRHQVQGRDVAAPGERERGRQDAGLSPGRSRGRERHHGPDARLGVGRGQRRPPSEAVPHDPDASGIEARVRIPRRAVEQVIQEEAHVRHPARDLLLGGLVLAVIQGRDHIAVAAQVRAE